MWSGSVLTIIMPLLGLTPWIYTCSNAQFWTLPHPLSSPSAFCTVEQHVSYFVVIHGADDLASHWPCHLLIPQTQTLPIMSDSVPHAIPWCLFAWDWSVQGLEPVALMPFPERTWHFCSSLIIVWNNYFGVTFSSCILFKLKSYIYLFSGKTCYYRL